MFLKHSLESGPADLFEGYDVCEEKTEDGYVHAKSHDLSTTSSVSLRMNLETDGWICASTNSDGAAVDVSCSIVYENQSYSLSYRFSDDYGNVGGIEFKWVPQQ